MGSFSPTQVRAGRATALLFGLQAAKGTPVDDFTVSTAGRLWTRDAGIDFAVDKSDPIGSMMEPQIPGSGRFEIPGPAQEALDVVATPTTLEWLLRSNWGPFSGGAFSLATQVNEWATLGWVENVDMLNPEYFLRLYDVWVHRLILGGSLLSDIRLLAEYAAESDKEPIELPPPSPIVLPNPPMIVTDERVFSGRKVQLIRDPLGAGTVIEPETLTLAIDQNLGAGWSMFEQTPVVFKRGFPGPLVQLEITGRVADETWAILRRARAGTRERYRLTAISEGSPVKTLQVEIHEMDFQVEPFGHEDQDYRQFRGVGLAHMSSGGNFVDITLT